MVKMYYRGRLPPHSHVHPDRVATVAAALNIAKTIASKSPVAVQGSKVILNYSHDHTVDEGLEYVVSASVKFQHLYGTL